jgi:hypothetical protein
MGGYDVTNTALKLFEGLGIQYVPTAERRGGPMESCCINVVDRLIKVHGLAHATIALRTLTASGKRYELVAPVITATSELILSHPRWASMGAQWVEAWGAVDIADILRTVKAANIRPKWIGIATLVAVKLTEVLGPSRPKPPKNIRVKAEPKPPIAVNRVPGVERNIALGVELLELRRTISHNTTFGRQVRNRFNLEPRESCRAMLIARIYAGRPEVYTRLSWIALVELSGPSTTEDVRKGLEARIIAGEAIGAPEIRKARGALKTGRPNVKQARRMAA